MYIYIYIYICIYIYIYTTNKTQRLSKLCKAYIHYYLVSYYT